MKFVASSARGLVFVASCALSLAAAMMPVQAHAQPNFPIKHSADGRHLVDQDGVPFLLNGDSPWYILQKANSAETLAYLDDRAALGFNGVLVMLIERGFAGGTTTEGHHPFGGTENLDNILSKINEDYFAYVDWFLTEANARNIVVLLPPAYLGFGGGGDGWAREFAIAGVDDALAWGRWLGTRYRSFENIIWVMGGDSDYASESHRIAHEAVIQGILETDDTHLVTGHCDRGNAALDCFDRPWLTLNGTYGDCDTAPGLSKADYDRIGRAPFIWYEGGYDSGSNGRCMRAQAYWSVLSASSGHLYGNSTVWPMNAGWQSGLGYSGAVSLQHFRPLFESRNWSALQPDFAHNVMTAGYGDIGGFDYAGSALTADGTTFVAYIITQRAITVDLSRISGSQVNVWWYGASDGSTQMVGTMPTSNTAAVFTPPDNSDWVLVIDDQAAGLPAPGTGTVTPPADTIAPSPPMGLTVT